MSEKTLTDIIFQGMDIVRNISDEDDPILKIKFIKNTQTNFWCKDFVYTFTNVKSYEQYLTMCVTSKRYSQNPETKKYDIEEHVEIFRRDLLVQKFEANLENSRVNRLDLYIDYDEELCNDLADILGKQNKTIILTW